MSDFAENQKLNYDSNFFKHITNNPELVGLDKDSLKLLDVTRCKELVVGEYLFCLWQHIGKESSRLLFNSQWRYGGTDWFDHRHHMLDTDKYFTDFWTLSRENVLKVLPMDGHVLDLCSGDGFYDYYFLRHRAAQIKAVEINAELVNHAKRLHSADNIEFLKDNVLTYEPDSNYF